MSTQRLQLPQRIAATQANAVIWGSVCCGAVLWRVGKRAALDWDSVSADGDPEPGRGQRSWAGNGTPHARTRRGSRVNAHRRLDSRGVLLC